MIKFLTLLAGLVAGVQSLDVAVSGPVARVELRINGQVVDEAAAPPWSLRCDLGAELHPAHLEAVAFDRDQRELGRDEQWINLPERRAEGAIVPIADDSGRVIAAELTWTSPEFDRPRSITAELDGSPISVSRSQRIDLSHVTPDELHVLTVDFHFAAGLTLKRQLAFGTGFSGDTVSGLTAVPVLLEDRDELPPPHALEGWIVAGGEPVSVVAMERGDGRLVIVRDPGAEDLIVELADERRRIAKQEKRRGAARELDTLDHDSEIRVLVAEPLAPRDRSRATLLFPYSERGVPGADGVLKAAAAPENRRLLGRGLMLGDAVALAGLRAAEGNPRRAVLLLLGPQREDVARFEPGAVRRFLGDLHVPLVVWDMSGPATSAPPAWGSDREIETFDDLARATRRLRSLLDRQRVIWVAGNHLPQALALGPNADGIALVR